MESKFYYYQDPGHGWVAVPVSLLEKLNIAGDISTYSYQRGKTVYLEEDRDLTIFFNAYRAAYGVDPILISKYSDGRSRIRSYDHYHKPAVAIQQKILEAAVDAGFIQFLTVGLQKDAAQ